jgi:hypothetical protein
MARKPKFVAPEPRQGLIQIIAAAKGKTELFPLVLMMGMKSDDVTMVAPIIWISMSALATFCVAPIVLA